MEPNDEDLIKRLNAKDKRAFEEVFKRFYSSLCYFAHKCVKDMDEAEDIVQDTFVWFYEHDNRFKDMLALKSFLYNCVYHKAMNYLKAQRVRSEVHEKLKAEWSEVDEEYEEFQVEAEVFEEIFRAIDELPTECGKIFRMSYIEHKSTKAIMEELHIAESTVKTQRQRAKEALRDKLKHLYAFAVFILFN